MSISIWFKSKSITGKTRFSAGDVISQKIDGTLDGDGWKPWRTAKIGFWGGVFAPFNHIWYKIIGL